MHVLEFRFRNDCSFAPKGPILTIIYYWLSQWVGVDQATIIDAQASSQKVYVNGLNILFLHTDMGTLLVLMV